MKRWIRRARDVFDTFLSAGSLWGWIRLAAAIFLVIIFARSDRFMWTEAGTQPVALWGVWGWRYLVFPVAALLGALLLGANYVKRLHMLPRWRMAWKHLTANAFGVGYPVLAVQDGKPLLRPGEQNLLQLVGGPGLLNIRPGSAVVVENARRPTAAHGAGAHFVARLERVRDYISLADQQRATELSLASKDGIEVLVKGIQYRFRLRAGHTLTNQHPRTPEDPYPFSAEAAFRQVYRRSVRMRSGQVETTPWDFLIKNLVEGVITDYVNQHWFDQLTTPRPYDPDPRQEMIGKMQSDALRDGMRNYGAELVWFDLGNFEPARPAVDHQRVDAWGMRWTGVADVNLATGEAERMAAHEMYRSQAQAEMLTSIMQALADAQVTRLERQNLLRLIISRTAQILDAMVEAGKTTASREQPEQPPSLTVTRMLLEE
jgi:hypothetical protein